MIIRIPDRTEETLPYIQVLPVHDLILRHALAEDHRFRYFIESGILPIWQDGNFGDGITVGVVDTGVHESMRLAGHCVEALDMTGENTPFDPNEKGHGTQMAQQVLAYAPNAKIVSMKVFPGRLTSQRDYNRTVAKATCRAISYAASVYPRLRVLNLSLSIPPGWGIGKCRRWRPCSVCSRVNEATDLGVVVVAAAGNRGRLDNQVWCPGRAEGAITVGSCLLNRDAEQEEDAFKGGDFSSFGTSYSAAGAAGSIALILSALPEAMPRQIRLALRETSTPLAQSSARYNPGLARIDNALRHLRSQLGKK